LFFPATGVKDQRFPIFFLRECLLLAHKKTFVFLVSAANRTGLIFKRKFAGFVLTRTIQLF